MRIERVQNFFSPEECAALNTWADDGVEKKWLDKGMSRGALGYPRRVTSRGYANRYEYPQLVRGLSDRVRKFCGVSEHPLIVGHGRDGVVVSCTLPGGDVYPHTDPLSVEGLATLRCNVMTRAPESGGSLFVGGKELPVMVGELHCYLASEHTHLVTSVGGQVSRVLWMFGAHVPADDWESGKIKMEIYQ